MTAQAMIMDRIFGYSAVMGTVIGIATQGDAVLKVEAASAMEVSMAVAKPIATRINWRRL
jgi:hypothetical protein